MKAKSRIWIEGEDGIFLGEGRIRLLCAIEKTGSISKAAKSLNMSYKKAWNLIDSINKNGAYPAVEKNTGGSGGGGAMLTPYGKKLIEIFSELNQKCWDFIDQEMESVEKQLKSDSSETA